MRITKLIFSVFAALIWLNLHAGNNQERKVFKLSTFAFKICFDDETNPDDDDMHASKCYIKSLVVKKGRFVGSDQNIYQLDLFCEQGVITDSIFQYLAAEVEHFEAHNSKTQESKIKAKSAVFNKFAALIFKFTGSELICNGIGAKYKPDLGFIKWIGAAHLVDEPMHTEIEADEAIITDGSGLKINFKGKKLSLINTNIDTPIEMVSGVLYLHNIKINAQISFTSQLEGIVLISKNWKVSKKRLKRIQCYLNNCRIERES